MDKLQTNFENTWAKSPAQIKRAITLLALGVSLLTLTGCGDETENMPNPTATPTTEAQPVFVTEEAVSTEEPLQLICPPGDTDPECS